MSESLGIIATFYIGITDRLLYEGGRILSTETIHMPRRIVLLSLCMTLLMAFALILAPVVGAASETNKTETKSTDNINITSDEAKLLTQRANIIDEAKKEAQVVVSEQLAIKAAQKATEVPTETAETTAPSSSSSEEKAETSSASNEDSYSESSSSTADEDYSENTVYASYSGNYLLDIDNPDPNYVGYSVSLSDSDRDQVERMLMGEAGSMGYTGMALVAQCIRDTYVSGSYSSMQQLFAQNGYYGSTSIAPSSTAAEVVNYIFDQGGSAVQHSIRVFYASNICSSPWHEAQDFVCSYGYVRFFDF